MYELLCLATHFSASLSTMSTVESYLSLFPAMSSHLSCTWLNSSLLSILSLPHLPVLSLSFCPSICHALLPSSFFAPCMLIEQNTSDHMHSSSLSRQFLCCAGLTLIETVNICKVVVSKGRERGLLIQKRFWKCRVCIKDKCIKHQLLWRWRGKRGNRWRCGGMKGKQDIGTEMTGEEINMERWHRKRWRLGISMGGEGKPSSAFFPRTV